MRHRACLALQFIALDAGFGLGLAERTLIHSLRLRLRPQLVWVLIELGLALCLTIGRGRTPAGRNGARRALVGRAGTCSAQSACGCSSRGGAASGSNCTCRIAILGKSGQWNRQTQGNGYTSNANMFSHSVLSLLAGLDDDANSIGIASDDRTIRPGHAGGRHGVRTPLPEEVVLEAAPADDETPLLPIFVEDATLPPPAVTVVEVR